MEYKDLPMTLTVDETDVIEGYAAVYDMVDNGNDIVAQGAFAKSLAMGRKTRLLWQHQTDSVLGPVLELSEDAHGLRFKGHILSELPLGREALVLLKAKAIDGLSIGYRVVKATERNGRRVILQADLWEVSVVTFPMNEAATVDSVKAADMTNRDMERLLTRDAGLSRSVARRLMAGGLDAVKAQRDAGDGMAELAQFMRLSRN
jgi:HK97 family phage prohead protease